MSGRTSWPRGEGQFREAPARVLVHRGCFVALTPRQTHCLASASMTGDHLAAELLDGGDDGGGGPGLADPDTLGLALAAGRLGAPLW